MQRLLSLLMLTWLLIAPLSQAQMLERFQEGVHYQSVSTANKKPNTSNHIEVAEFFWYGCSHCFHFEKFLGPWLEKLPEDVTFNPVPAVWNSMMQQHAKLHYAFEALGILTKKAKADIFSAIQVRSEPLDQEDAIVDMLIKHGANPDDAKAAFNSFSVNSKAKQAAQLMRSMQVRGVPTLVIGGQYMVDAKLAGGQPQMLEVADFLIEKLRLEKITPQPK